MMNRSNQQPKTQMTKKSSKSYHLRSCHVEPSYLSGMALEYPVVNIISEQHTADNTTKTIEIWCLQGG